MPSSTFKPFPMLRNVSLKPEMNISSETNIFFLYIFIMEKKILVASWIIFSNFLVVLSLVNNKWPFQLYVYMHMFTYISVMILYISVQESVECNKISEISRTWEISLKSLNFILILFVYQKLYQHSITFFLVQNSPCEFTTHTHKFRKLFEPKKIGLNTCFSYVNQTLIWWC